MASRQKRKKRLRQAQGQAPAPPTQAQGPPPPPAQAQGPPPPPAQARGPPPAQAPGGQPPETASGPSGEKRKRVVSFGDKTGAPGKEKKSHSDGEIGETLAKKKRVSPLVSTGQSPNVNARHGIQYSSLLSLITSDKGELKFTDDPNAVMDDGSSHSIHMEWDEEKGSYFIIMSRASRKLDIKFELLSVFDAEQMDTEAIKPILSFSQGFDSDEQWRETKLLLQEVFGPPVASDVNPNYVYAFTKTRQKFHIRLFKINNWPSDVDQGLRLVKCGPSFVLQSKVLSDSNGDSSFLDEDLFSMDERTEKLDLMSSAVMHDPTCLSQIGHHVNGLGISFIPAPPDTTDWEGYNTTAEEFFSRYNAFRSTEVPGTGLPPSAYKTKLHKHPWKKETTSNTHLCQPFKLFGRSLILQCEEVFAKPACYERIELKNIYFRGRKLKLLGVKLVPYSEDKAAENLQQVGTVLGDLIRDLGLAANNFPPELKDVLALLERKEPGGECLAVAELVIQSKNHICWMLQLDKIFLLEELFIEYDQMELDEQLLVGMAFPDLRTFQNKIMKNWLLEHCYSHMLSGKKGKRKASRESTKSEISRQLQKTMSKEEADKKAAKLLGIRRVMKTIRNWFQHLPESAIELLKKMSREECESIVSAYCTDVYMKAQKGVTQVFANRCKRTAVPTRLEVERASYSRYGRYFQAPESIHFREEDIKSRVGWAPPQQQKNNEMLVL